MAILKNQRVIAIEEHYYDPEIVAYFQGADAKMGAPLRSVLEEVGEGRIKAIDEVGVDVQVLSHGAPSTQRMDAESGVRVAKAANDRLCRIAQNHPDRFAAFATLPTADPIAAANELERSVEKLGFKGAMVHGLVGEDRLFIDDKQFWPIFERAQSLDVPLYIHPANPHPAMVDIYLKDYVESYPHLLQAGWGPITSCSRSTVRSSQMNRDPSGWRI